MRRRARAAAFRAVLTAGLALPSASFALGQGDNLSGRLAAGAEVVRLEAPAGSYVEGSISASAAPVVLHLLDASGQPRRRLTEGEGRQVFRAVTQAGDALAVSGAAGAAFSLQIDKLVPPEDQPLAEPEYLSPVIAALASELAAGGDTVAFWEKWQAEGTPVVEQVEDIKVLTFLYRGAVRNVRLFGGPSSDHDWLERLGDSDVWFRSYRVPASTRLAYRLAPDIPEIPGTAQERRAAILATAAADPLNRAPWPVSAPDAFNQWPTIALPDAPLQPGYPVTGQAAALEEGSINSALLGNSRRLAFYRSPGFDPADPEALLLIVFDGPRAQTEMEVPGALDALTSQSRLPPLAAVFVDAIDTMTRGRELPGNPRFADFLADELLPMAQAHFGLTADPTRTVLAGASYGGIGATNAVLSRPESFGAAISMSGSYWWSPEGHDGDLPFVAQRVLDLKPMPLRFFISAGTFETSRDAGRDIRETSRLVYATLNARGYTAIWREYAAGHDSFVWRGTLMDGLIALFGR